jgi:hypothetical protein
MRRAVLIGTLLAISADARTYGVRLAYNATAKAWILPATAVNVCVFVNGLRETQLTISSGKVYIAGIPSDALVIADFD